MSVNPLLCVWLFLTLGLMGARGPFAAVATFSVSSRWDQGDIDEDGDVDTDDIDLLWRQITGIEKPSLESDVNRDGTLDATDVQIVFELLEVTRRAPIEGRSLVNVWSTETNPLIDGEWESLWDETDPWIIDPQLPYQYQRQVGGGAHDDHPAVEARFRWGLIDDEPYLFGFIVAPDLYLETGCPEEGGTTSDGLRSLGLFVPRLTDRGQEGLSAGMFLGGLYVDGLATQDMARDEVEKAVAFSGSLDDSVDADDVESRYEFSIPLNLLSPPEGVSSEEIADTRLALKLVWVDHDESPGDCENATPSFQVRWSGGPEAGSRVDSSLDLQLGFADQALWLQERQSVGIPGVKSSLIDSDNNLWMGGISDSTGEEREALVLKSSDFGMSRWEKIAALPTVEVSSLEIFGGSLYVGTGSMDQALVPEDEARLYRIDESGAALELSELRGDGPSAISGLKAFEEIFLAARSDVTDAEIWWSQDGDSWSLALDLESMATQKARSLTSFYAFDAEVFFGADNGRIYRSEDGLSWFEETLAPGLDVFMIVAFEGLLYIGGQSSRAAGPVATLFRRDAPGIFTRLFASDTADLGEGVVVDRRIDGVQLGWASFLCGGVIEDQLVLAGTRSAPLLVFDGSVFRASRSLDKLSGSSTPSLSRDIVSLIPLPSGFRDSWIQFENPGARVLIGQWR